MDFSWVKELAEQSNVLEEGRRAKDRAEKEDQRTVALATAPFVEKLYHLFNTCGDEFNKFVNYNQLRVTTTRVQKKVKGTINPEDPELSYPEEVAYFIFSRGDWTYGVRGGRGAVEFIEFPNAGGGPNLSLRLDETAVAPSRKLIATIDSATGQIVWSSEEGPVDGPAIVSICRDYFRDFIEKTNPHAP